MEKAISEIFNQLTVDEKIYLCSGYSNMCMGKLDKYNLSEVTMGDGPQGLRREGDGEYNTALPSGISLAASWDIENAENFGALIATECLGCNVQVSLGPGMNLMRTPLNGRNFEYYGEDAVLAGKIAGGYIKGCQSLGVAATPKHLACNNQEICRTTGSSVISEKVLRELYLEPFEIVVKDAQPWMMMSSYNKINGTYASAYTYTQQTVIKDELGFDGVMVSDWGGAHDAYGCAVGGLDLEMGLCANSVFGAPLTELVKSGEVPISFIDEKVRRILRLMFRVGCFPGAERQKGENDTSANHEKAKKLAEQGVVLLKNQNNFLPLNFSGLKKVLVCGPSANFQHCIGMLEKCGGSGAVHPSYEITPLAGLKTQFSQVEFIYEPGIKFDSDFELPKSMIHGKVECEYFQKFSDLEQNLPPYATEKRDDISFHWNRGLTAGATQDKFINDPDLSVRAKCTLKVAESGPVELMLISFCRKAQLFMNDELVIKSDTQNSHMIHGVYKFEAKAGQELHLTMLIEGAPYQGDCRLLWKQNQKVLRQKALDAAKTADAVLYFGGTNHSYDREALGWGNFYGADIPDLELPDEQAEFIVELAKNNAGTVVNLINGSVVDVEPFIDLIPALLEFWYPGQESGNVVADILSGRVNPSGHLPCTWAKKLNDYACHANGNYPGSREAENPEVRYDEGIFIGYRYFDKERLEPRFPFGFGLSYTEFTQELAEVKLKKCDLGKAEIEVEITVNVRNCGNCSGSEVVQIYVGDKACSKEERPVKTLRAFQKVRLDVNESKQVKFNLTWRDFAYYDADLRKFTVASGIFKIILAKNAGKTIAETTIEIQ